MKRSNLRFNKRLKVRESMEERVIYLEKANDLLMRSNHVQGFINKELLGKHNTTHKRLVKITDRLKAITEHDDTVNSKEYDLVRGLADELQNLTNKVDVMEEILEEIA